MDNKTVTMAHGAGGRQTSELIDEVFKAHFANPDLTADDAAVLVPPGREKWPYPPMDLLFLRHFSREEISASFPSVEQLMTLPAWERNRCISPALL